MSDMQNENASPEVNNRKKTNRELYDQVDELREEVRALLSKVPDEDAVRRIAGEEADTRMIALQGNLENKITALQASIEKQMSETVHSVRTMTDAVLKDFSLSKDHIRDVRKRADDANDVSNRTLGTVSQIAELYRDMRERVSHIEDDTKTQIRRLDNEADDMRQRWGSVMIAILGYDPSAPTREKVIDNALADVVKSMQASLSALVAKAEAQEKRQAAMRLWGGRLFKAFAMLPFWGKVAAGIGLALSGATAATVIQYLSQLPQ